MRSCYSVILGNSNQDSVSSHGFDHDSVYLHCFLPGIVVILGVFRKLQHRSTQQQVLEKIVHATCKGLTIFVNRCPEIAQKNVRLCAKDGGKPLPT